MSYGVSAALQAAIYQHLAADPDVIAQVGGDIFDAPPKGARPDLFVTLGPEIVKDRSDVSGDGAEHRFEVTVTSEQAGFAGAKAVAVAICDALHDADLTLSRGRLVFLRFERANARRAGQSSRRQIDLRFLARVEDN